MNIYTIFSNVDQSADQLILAPTDDRISRDFGANLRARNAELVAKKFPPVSVVDNTIYCLGSYDSKTMQISLLDSPRQVEYNLD